MKQVGFACQTGLKAGTRNRAGAFAVKEVSRKGIIGKVTDFFAGKKTNKGPQTGIGAIAHQKGKGLRDITKVKILEENLGSML